MKKLLAVFVTAALFLVPLNAIAAVKAGAACSKLGATSTSAGKKYTCIKSGKKLVWNSGAAIATPKPSATPTSSPIPTPTQSPEQGTSSVKIQSGDDCKKLGDQIVNSAEILECRYIRGKKLVWIARSRETP